MSGALLIYATPQFWLALLAVIFFSLTLGWLPPFGMETVASTLTGWARVGDIALHLILPTVSLGCFFMAIYARLTRASMLEVLGMDFIKTARAKGVPVPQIIRRHALRNALLPVITFAGIQLGQMAGGAVLTETVFGWLRHRPADVRRPGATRLPAAAGRVPDHLDHGGGLQPDHRPDLPIHRPRIQGS